MGLFSKLLERAAGKKSTNDFEQHYFLGKELGKGAFAEVREVTRKSDGKKLACKIMHKSKAKDEEEAIQLEIAVLQQLHHPHVVGLKDMFVTKNHYYLVMDLAAGGELFERILERGFYTEKDAAAVVKQLLDALVYMHDEVGVVHRDLKPENLLFADRSETAPLLITDFGLSRILKDNDFLSTTCGTPHYVAPEILREAGHSFPVDMWALGVITYVLLCGYTPFWGGEANDMNVLYGSILSGKYDYSDENWSLISDPAKDFIDKLLQVSPDKRMMANEAIQHPWLSTKADVDILPQVRKNFKAKGTLKKAMLAVKMLNRLEKLHGTSANHIASSQADNEDRKPSQ